MVVHAILDELGVAVDFYARPELAAGALSALRNGNPDQAGWTTRSLPAGAPGVECDERVFTVVDDLRRLESAHADYESADTRMRCRDAEAAAQGQAPCGRQVTSHVLIRELPNRSRETCGEVGLERAG